MFAIGPLAALPNESAAQEPSSSVGDPLAPEELARRRAQLDKWAFEPVALEASAARFLLDRRTSRFFIRDRESAVRWYSSWAHKGFAAVRVDDEETPRGRWVALDQVTRLVADSHRIRLSVGTPTAPELALDLVVEIRGERGFRIRYDVPERARSRTAAVRVLDGCFWLADAGGGGVVVPSGAGRWFDAADVAPSGTVRLRAYGEEGATGADAHLSLPCLGVLRRETLISGEMVECPLLISWEDPAIVVEVARERPGGDAFPGRRALSVRLESSATSGHVDVSTLGRSNLHVVDVARAHREALEAPLASLRYKTGVEPRHRSLIGAAWFRAAPKTAEEHGRLSEYAGRLSGELGIDRAIFVFDGAAATLGDEETAPPPSDARAELLASLRDRGYLTGARIPLARVDTLLDVAGAPDGEVAWERRAAALRGREAVALSADEGADYDLPIFVLPPGVDASPLNAQTSAARAGFFAAAKERFRIIGVTPALAADLPHVVFAGGMGTRIATPPGATFVPFVHATFGHTARIDAAGGVPLRPNDPAAFLVHLLVGEMPRYALPAGDARPAPPASETNREWVFARDDGWAGGRGWSADDVFLRNTYEVLSHVARHRSRTVMLFTQKLNPAGTAFETYFGPDMRIVVNFGPGDYEDEAEGLVLPPYGFYVRYPFLLAFHALRANDVSYDSPAFFVIRSLEGKMVFRAERVNVYRGFGPKTLELGGRRYEVEREIVTKFH